MNLKSPTKFNMMLHETKKEGHITSHMKRCACHKAQKFLPFLSVSQYMCFKKGMIPKMIKRRLFISLQDR
jgi:hypothetical protein